MSNYIKSTSTYTLRKRSQGINGGAIYERDWTSLEGQKLRFGRGKTPLYTDGNFVFTRSSFRTSQKKNKVSEIVASYKYDDVKDSKSAVNNVELNTDSNDIRTFAYYGSCVELVKNAITNIINTFPASLYTANSYMEYTTEDGTIDYVTDRDGKPLMILYNPFEIDLLTKSVLLEGNENKYRFMCESYENYEINGETIKGFTVDYNFSKCKEDDQWYNFKTYYENNVDREAPVVIIFYLKNEKEIKLLGFKVNNDITFLSSIDNKNLVIKPKKEIIEEYFDKLEGFEKQLLNRKTKPLYKNTLVTPVEGETTTLYVKRNYIWPTVNDYCIDISSPSYGEFVNNLLNMANAYDEVWSNNLYNRMTHEAIKNFDWTYTKEYLDGEEQDNIDGGLRMQKILFLTGYIFDRAKQYIDGIKNTNKCTYDNMCNIPEALLSDKLELSGWDTISTIPIPIVDENNSGYVKLSQDFIDEKKYKWYGNSNTDIIDSSTYDTNFMKRLLLSSKKIFSSKGTQEAIDMIMGMFGFGRGTEYIVDNDKVTINNKTYDVICNNVFINGKGYEVTNNRIIVDCDFEVVEQSYKVKLNKDMTLEKVSDITYQRTDVYNEDDEPFLNLPLANFLYNEIEVRENGITTFKRNKEDERVSHSFIIPFYEKDKDYIRELYFQSKGGWGHLNEYKNFNEYLETIPYLNVVNDVSDLFKTNSLTVNEGDIYYVYNLENYPIEYNLDKDSSHFFYYKEGAISTYFPSSWANIKLSDTSSEYYKKAMYLNSIIGNKLGNNPHCGFGKYDKGDDFKKFMSEPFSYLTENDLVTEEETKDLKFDITNITNLSKTLTESQYNEEYYYLNSKILILKNKNNNEYYKKYFRNVILHYLLQVIPSTTILVLEDF